MAMATPQPEDKKRVKVYELKNNDWFDRGTGFCKGILVDDEPHILVEAEDLPQRVLLDSKVSKDDGYQKQQDTLIVWTENDGTDMALSFQEPEGCAAIWQFVSDVQQQLISLDDTLSDGTTEVFSQPSMPPNPELGNLSEIEQFIRVAAASPGGRDTLAKFIINDGYINKLIPLVGMAEDLEDLDDLHKLCNIMKTLILLNDSTIIEYVVTDEIVLGVVGALEYDPDFPSHKANHRQYLADKSKFKEVVRINDEEIQRKIHHTWRLQYLKDVVLARILDDPTFSVLNSLIFFNQVDIVQHLQENTTFLMELFGIFANNDANDNRKQDAVHFIQQCCSIAKSLQAPSRVTFYNNLIQAGLFNVMRYALTHSVPSIRCSGTEILVALLDHDPAMLRAYLMKALNEGKSPLTDTLIDLLLKETDLGVKTQLADSIKVLLDPGPIGSNNSELSGRQGLANEFLSKLRNSSTHQADSFLQTFYEQSAKKLFRPLKDLEHRQSLDNLTLPEVTLFQSLVDILTYFIRQHQYRTKFLMLTEGLSARIAQLLTAPQKHLKLIAIKFFRTIVGLKDPFYYTQMTKDNTFELILNVVYETMPRDNLLNSACLEFFDCIRHEEIIPVLNYIVENFREKLLDITYIDTFQTLVQKYDDLQNAATQAAVTRSEEMQTSMFSGNDPRGNANVHAGRWIEGVGEMDADEEAYFNASDDEEELPTQEAQRSDASSDEKGQSQAVANGASPILKPLVDYPDDDEDNMLSNEATQTIEPQTSFSESRPAADHSFASLNQASSRETGPPSPSAASTSPVGPPPERLSEKRRRDEDDEDELSKLAVQTKRRSSSAHSPTSPTSDSSVSHNAQKQSSASSNSTAHNSHHAFSFTNSNTGVRRKKVFSPSHQDKKNGGIEKERGKKIAISLSLSVWDRLRDQIMQCGSA